MLNRLGAFAMAAILLGMPASHAQETTLAPGAAIIGAEVGMNAMDFDAARNSFFYQNDIDGDFALSFTEMADAMAQGGSRLFDGYDLDGDGLISYDEYVQHGTELFASLDANGDGVLSPLEM